MIIFRHVYSIVTTSNPPPTTGDTALTFPTYQILQLSAKQSIWKHSQDRGQPVYINIFTSEVFHATSYIVSKNHITNKICNTPCTESWHWSTITSEFFKVDFFLEKSTLYHVAEKMVYSFSSHTYVDLQ